MSRFTWSATPCQIARHLFSGALLAGLLLASGCDTTEDFDHTAPPGQGALIVDNNGEMNVSVYVDGVLIGEVNDGHWEAFDLTPGVPRVVLDETNGDRTFAADVDILEGRNSILDVSVGGSDHLSVSLSID
ncbi:MAG: hypothetical protein K8T26_08860 [Lentisphaerae bacterium]|nr:hypothetical protein [Lentisphaerota bacterium]